jgi:uncharacterized C2H2 Zn-finger protein
MKMGEALQQEREALLAQIERGKEARVRLRQVDILLTMYGDDVTPPEDAKTCPRCPGRVFKGEKGLRHHRAVAHKVKAKPKARVRKRPATSTRRPTRRAA